MANKNFVVRHGLEVSGNGGIAGNLGVSGSLSVGGSTTLADIQTTSLSITNGAQVGGALTVTGVADLNNNLQVASNTSVGGELIVTGVADLNSALQVSGNTSLKGTLQVNGNTSIAANLDVDQNLDVGATLCVAGNTNIVGVTTIGGKLHVSNDISSSGNGQFQSVLSGAQLRTSSFRTTGTLNVQGGSYLSGAVQAKGNTSIGGVLTVTSSTNLLANAAVAGTLSVQGGSYLSGSIQAKGILSAAQLRSTSANVAGTLTVQGASYLSGAVQAKGTLSVGGRLTAGGDIQTTSLSITNGAQVGGALTVTGITDFNGNSSVCGQMQVTGLLSGGQLRTSSFRTTGTLTVLGGSYLSGSVQAKGILSGNQLRCTSLRVTGGTAAICGSMDICGSLQVGGFISANTYNFEMFGAVPAYNNSDYSTINWSIANSAIQLRSSTDTTIGMAFPAFRVNSAANVLGRWRITIQVKASAAASSGLYIRVYEYDGEMPAGKIAISNDAANSVVQEDTRLGTISPTTENVAIGTDWVTKTFYYTPTGTAVYASIVVLNWTGIGTNHLYVRPPVLQPEYSGFVSATTLRTASLRVTGGTAAICGSMDICGSLQVAAVLSAGQFRGTSNNLQRGNISAMTYGSLNGGYVSATTLRTSSFRVATTAYVCGNLQATFASAGQLRCASLRVTGGTAAICGSMDISGSLQVAAVLSGGQIRGVSGGWQRDSVSLRSSTTVATYDKLRVWNGSQYTIGMRTGLYHGGLNNDYAMTFTFNNSNTRGFLWRHADMTVQQGAMSLTAGQGLLTVAGGVRIGYGIGDQSSPATNGMQVNGTISCDAIHAGASTIQTTGTISGGLVYGLQLRCASLRVTGGTAAICGSMDICGSLQVASSISCNGLHAAASAIQTTGTISGGTIYGGQLRCTSFKSEERLFVSSAGTTGNTVEIRAGGSGNHFLLYQYSTNQQYGGTMHIATAHRTNTTAFQFLGCYSNNGQDTEYVLRGQGTAGADISWQGGGVDYAEFFEWKDGNPNNEPRFGQPVYLISGEKIALATSGHIPIGVISKNPAVTGGSAWNKWEQKYLRDEWNAYIRNEDGERILNPDFDPDQEYIPREERSEWDAVGLMGKLPIQKDYITDTIRNNTGWLKMTDINDNVEKWLVR